MYLNSLLEYRTFEVYFEWPKLEVTKVQISNWLELTHKITSYLCSLLELNNIRLAYFFLMQSMDGVSYFRLSLCVCVCPVAKYLKQYWTDQLHFWRGPSLWPREETIRIWKKLPRGKGGCGGLEIWP